MAEPRLLISNRGEIALRILRTAKKLGICTVAIYTLADATTPHVSRADEAYLIGDGMDPRGYLNIDLIVDIAKRSKATMVAPGYGFLSENAEFASAIEAEGITFLGPTPHQMTSMGLKHEARAVAIKANVPVVPGSGGVLQSLDEAVDAATKIGYPVLIKASGGGGGMGMEVCRNEDEVREKYEATRSKGQTLFRNPDVFMEKYIGRARHVEIQIFGNGQGHVIHMGERECSVQRRHQKVIEETPCALFLSERGQEARDRMCAAAVSLGQLIKYRSAGTVEFILDSDSPNYDFYFLELNARIQVEHAVTEVVRPGLDLVELMIRQGMSEGGSLDSSTLDQGRWADSDGHSIEVRVYCENPTSDFRPSPGRLHHVEWADIGNRGRIDTWVQRGTVVTPHYDPMIAKLVVHGADRDAAIARALQVIKDSRISGPPNNMDYCYSVLDSEDFRKGTVYTSYLDSFKYTPKAIEILTAGVSTTVQDLPGRFTGAGIPRGGPADMLSFQIANILVDNEPTVEGLEFTMMGAGIRFHTDSVIALTGAEMPVLLDKQPAKMWETIHVKAGSVLSLGAIKSTGMRTYLAIRGGFPYIAPYMGSKSTFAGAGLSGYQGRALLPGDLLEIAPSSDANLRVRTVPDARRPTYGTQWDLEVTPSAQWDAGFLHENGMKTLLESTWTVTPASNRSGLRIDGPRVEWSRPDGGDGGSHPSNVLDQGYAFAALNVNGDTPVLFGVDGPDMGGFANVLALARASAWKLGQMKPGDTINFVLVSTETAVRLAAKQTDWIASIEEPVADCSLWRPSSVVDDDVERSSSTSSTLAQRRDVRICMAADEFLQVEVGEMVLDFATRLKIELWERSLRAKNVSGIIYYNTCIRSSIIHFDPAIISAKDLTKIILDTMDAIEDVQHIELPMNIYRLPVVPDDPWTHDAIEFYMKTARNKAVYLPNNCKYVARNNGLPETAVSDALLKTRWLVLARGFFVMLPFIVPMDPRHRLLAQKYNPSRTRSPEGAIGLAGVIGSIYPIESPGGYQLLGRTLTTWRPWSDDPCLVETFDQIEFYEVGEEEFVETERMYKAGMFQPEKRQETFNMADYLKGLEILKPEVDAFRSKQKTASDEVTQEERVIFADWQEEKRAEEKALEAKKAQGVQVVGDGEPVVSPLSANVWKFYVQPGDIIKSEDQRIVELEAMKTSVWITPGEGNVGKKVASYAVKEGDTVEPGGPLLYLQ